MSTKPFEKKYLISYILSQDPWMVSKDESNFAIKDKLQWKFVAWANEFKGRILSGFITLKKKTIWHGQEWQKGKEKKPNDKLFE